MKNSRFVPNGIEEIQLVFIFERTIKFFSFSVRAPNVYFSSSFPFKFSFKCFLSGESLKRSEELAANANPHRTGFCKRRFWIPSAKAGHVVGKFSDINHFRNELMIRILSAVILSNRDAGFSDPLNVSSAFNAFM